MQTSKTITGADLPEFGSSPQPQPGIVLAGKYSSVHSKAWITPKKKPELRRDRHVKGACSIRTPKGKRRFDNTEEMLKAMWQDTDAQLEAYRLPDQESFTNIEKQTGQGMFSNELIKKILKLNPKMFVEDSVNVPGCCGFYKVVGTEKVACGIPNASLRRGFVPEFTIVQPDAADLPVGFIYGWRQVLTRLRKSGDLTMTQINKIWGHVHYNDERAKHHYASLGRFTA